jgi:predicted ATP-grasp superfamily ATP-dependent carboligase
LIAFKQKKIFLAAAKSRLVHKLITFSDNGELFDLLTEFKAYKVKPVLFLTSDSYLLFIAENREHFQNIFNIIIPENATIDLLMKKSLFYDFALKNNILIPKTSRVIIGDNTVKSIEKLEFPIVIKPTYRKGSWDKAGFPKVFLCNNEKEYLESYRKAISVEKDLIVQEFIPGGDSDIYYCMTYYDGSSRCLGTFTGKKIRQWPVDYGTATSTTITDEEFVTSETIRVFNMLEYAGFGSIEYKKSQKDGKFYIMEATVGRLDQTEFVTTVHGVNLPLIGYGSQTNKTFQIRESNNKMIIYIDSYKELFSAIKHINRNDLTLSQWLKSLKGKKAYLHFYKKDPIVGLLLFIEILELFLNKTKLVLRQFWGNKRT